MVHRTVTAVAVCASVAAVSAFSPSPVGLPAARRLGRATAPRARKHGGLSMKLSKGQAVAPASLACRRPLCLRYSKCLHPYATQRACKPVSVTDITKGEVHGEGGAYVAGYWVPYDNCDEHFNIKGGSNELVPDEPCPRSRTRHSAAKVPASTPVAHCLSPYVPLSAVVLTRRVLAMMQADGSYDVAIIGAGAIGAAIARGKFVCRPWHDARATAFSGCPRKRTRATLRPATARDVLIFLTCRRWCRVELAKTSASVVMLEAGDDVSQGATKGNSGIVHAGFDDKPGSVRVRFFPTH